MQEVSKILAVNNFLKGALRNFKISQVDPTGKYFFWGSHMSKKQL